MFQQPLVLALHGLSDRMLGYSVLPLNLPTERSRKPDTDAEALLEPLAALCEERGPRLPAGRYRYELHYPELLDRDGGLALCAGSQRNCCRRFMSRARTFVMSLGGSPD